MTSVVVFCKSAIDMVDGAMERLDVKVLPPSNELHRRFSEQPLKPYPYQTHSRTKLVGVIYTYLIVY